MKRIAILLPLIVASLTGCGSSGSQTIELTKDNFSTYVATNSMVAYNNMTYDYATYFTHFIGANGCSFIDCTVTYRYVTGSVETNDASDTTVPLSLSGDGEAKPFMVRLTSTVRMYSFYLVSVSGKVEIRS